MQQQEWTPEVAAQIFANFSVIFPPVVVENYAAHVAGYVEYQDDPVGFCEEMFGESYTDDIKAMMESVRDYPVTIAKSANATGKTHGAARVAAWFIKCFEDSQVYTAAAPPEANLKTLLWGEIGTLINQHPTIFKEFKQNVLHLERHPKSFLTGVTIPTSGDDATRQAKFSGKHAPNLMFIIDEADAVPDAVYKGIESCASGGHVRVLCMFNPRAESGPVYRMERDGRANVVTLSAFNHPNVIVGTDVIPGGAVDRETTVRRINQWCRRIVEGEKVDQECFELPEFLVGSVAKDQKGSPYSPLKAGFYKIINSAFAYMVLGRYPAQGTNQLISREWTAAARARWDLYVAKWGEVPPNGVSGVMGLDCAEMGNDLNKCCFRYGGWVDHLTGWGGVDMIETGDKAALEYHKRTLRAASVDANGVGAGVAPHMRRLRCNAYGIKAQERPTVATEMGEFKIIRDQLWWAVREWLRVDSGSMLPPDDELLEELHTVTYDVVNGKIQVMDQDTIKELLKRSPNSADALRQTFAEVKQPTLPHTIKPIRKVRFAW
ncbi:MAG: hypothetical protein ABIJ57_03130 [Pseudomonadota bacterium]